MEKEMLLPYISLYIKLEKNYASVFISHLSYIVFMV